MSEAWPKGFRYLPGWLDRSAQSALVCEMRSVVERAPLYTPVMPGSGRPMRVRMTNCGRLGWVTDKTGGYRYQAHHPVTGAAWPPMPASLIGLWRAVSDDPRPPEACLVNVYDDAARLGLHQDRDEEDFQAPVVSVSLGDACRFRLGGLKRGDPTRSLRLESGDIIVLGGEARLAYHGVDRIYPRTSDLLAGGGRINLTLRRVRR